MLKYFKILLCSVVAVLAVLNTLEACTTAIISGKYTVDGRPLLWKHRDSGFEQNKIMHFEDGQYPYLGLINTVDTLGTEVWAGYNTQGFAIMNSASYNLKPHTDTTKLKDQEGVVMKKALQSCATISDFERLLQSWPKPIGVEANFGVIDARGGAAYFETSNFDYTKIDVNDPAVAPFGYVVRTNYSYYGKKNDGYGFIRENAAEMLLRQAVNVNNLSARWLLQKAGRSLKHGLLQRDLWQEPLPSADEAHFAIMTDYIPRPSSVSTVVVHGVRQGQNTEWATMWTILGFQLTSVALPLWVQAGPALPQVLQSQDGQPAPLCDFSLKLKERCFPIKRGSGYRYLNLSALANKQTQGILQKLKPVENQIFERHQELMQNWQEAGQPETVQMRRWYEDIDQHIRESYNQAFGL
ncbi:MAG: hypothetical protein GF313_16920 [Caldithrix sp.]|nr:hypothetical protein [Caldithrix sp.]